MDTDLKDQLRDKLEAIAPEYGMVELAYPSFVRAFGYRSRPLSAADALEAVSALLDVSDGVKMEVEVEGARNGGEWFGGGRAWEAADQHRWRENVPPSAAAKDGEEVGEKAEVQWWARNFWAAFDALDE
jgi:cell division control protein 45